MPQVTSIMVASLCPAALVSFVYAILAEAEPRNWADVVERFGLPVVAAGAAAWVAYKLAFSVIAREWSRSDAQDARWEAMHGKWDTITERNIAALTSVEKAMNEVCVAIKTCKGSQPPHSA